MMEKCKSDTKNRGTATAVRNRESSRYGQNHARKYVSDLG